MKADPIRAVLRRQPFQPFRITLSSGEVHDVAGPEWCMVTHDTTVVGVPGESGDGEFVTLLWNMHITSVKPIGQSVPPAA